MMIIPYGTENDDGFIGYLSIAIVALCLVAFGLTWPAESRLVESIQKDSLETWIQRDRETLETMPTLDQIEWVRRTSRQVPGFQGLDTSAFQEMLQADRQSGAAAEESHHFPEFPRA